MKTSLHDLTFPALERELLASGVRPVHARALWRALHREGQVELAGRADFPPPLRRWVDGALGEGGRFHPETLEVTSDIASSDGLTRKFLLRLADGQTVETVAMGYPRGVDGAPGCVDGGWRIVEGGSDHLPSTTHHPPSTIPPPRTAPGRFTACLSTQAGCAMGCVFCATGQMGFVRHLRAGEIVAQVLHVQRTLRARGEAGLRNLVLMGMGEPLHNYDAVMTALEIITDTGGLNIGPSRISVSTVGVVPGILRMAEERRPYNLAVSLHGATESERAALVPASRRWPLAELMAACRTYAEKTGRRIFFGWTLIAGANDTPEQAATLAALLAGIDAHVNLIPLNPTDGYAGTATAAAAASAFSQTLQAAGIPCTIRQRRGIDVAAGCGQLRAEKGR